MRTRRSQAAFTLAEILVVIVIISILAALLLPAVLKGKDQVRITEAKQRIQALSLALDSFYNDFGFYPPTNGALNPNTGEFGDDIAVAYDDDANSSGVIEQGEVNFEYNEALVFCLCNKFTKGTGDEGPTNDIIKIKGTGRVVGKAPVNGGPYLEVKQADLVDRDGDGWLEMIDPWGSPYIYIPRSDYLKTDGTYNAGALRMANQENPPDVAAVPVPEHIMRDKFQLICLGPDTTTAGFSKDGGATVAFPKDIRWKDPETGTEINSYADPYKIHNPALIGQDCDQSSPWLAPDHPTGTADDINNWK